MPFAVRNITVKFPGATRFVINDLSFDLPVPGFHALFGPSGVGKTTLAMAGTIVAEFIVADAGIGYAIQIALFQSDPPKILVALFLIGMTLSIYQGLLEVAGFLIKSAWTQKK